MIELHIKKIHPEPAVITLSTKTEAIIELMCRLLLVYIIYWSSHFRVS